jgi:hypothetical protein
MITREREGCMRESSHGREDMGDAGMREMQEHVGEGTTEGEGTYGRGDDRQR